MTRVLAAIALAVLSVFGSTGCLYSNDTPESDAAVVSIQWALVTPSATERFYNVLIEVRADDLRTVRRSFPLTSGDTPQPYEIRMSIPSGRDREFLVKVTDNMGERAYDGRTKVDLSPGSQSVAVSLQGWSQIRGTFRKYDAATGGPGDPVADAEGAVVGSDRITVTTDADGVFSYEMPNGVEIEMTGPVGNTELGLARVIGAVGGEDLFVDLIAIDPETRPHRHTIQGASISSANPGELQLFGSWVQRAGDPIVAIIEDPDGGGFRLDTVADPDDETRLVVALPELEDSLLPYRVVLRNDAAGDSNWIDLNVR
ncbi:MAG: hypothetical protein IT350_04020 [Deltaproteobacteria bacterium]|nr:hypothetical protein [Deltaproteobacteria bacterium]